MSNNLALSQIASNQLNKHVTANDQAGELDAAITEPMAVPVDDTNAVTLRSDAPTANGATRTLTSSYVYYHDVFEQRATLTSPSTGTGVVTFLMG